MFYAYDYPIQQLPLYLFSISYQQFFAKSALMDFPDFYLRIVRHKISHSHIAVFLKNCLCQITGDCV